MMKKLAQLGDVNPIEHGGGFIFEDPDGQQFVEWCANVDERVSLYRAYVPANVFAYYDWAGVEDIAQYCGGDTDFLREQSSSEDLFSRAMLIIDLASYYGWENLDHEPLTLSPSEICKRWDLSA